MPTVALRTSVPRRVRWKNDLRALLLIALASLVWALTSFDARAETRTVGVSAVGPTQMEFGRDAAQLMIAKWKKDAVERGVPLETFVKDVLIPKIQGDPLPGIVDPKGTVRVTDGHHRVWALTQISEETNVPISVRVDVKKNYTGVSLAEYSNELVASGAAYFTPEVRGVDATKRAAHLPANFSGLKNNPLRSAIGTTLFRAGVDSGAFADYLEFYAGEHLLANGLVPKLRAAGILGPKDTIVPESMASDAKLLGFLHDEFFGQDPTMRDFLRARVRPGFAAAAEAALAKASPHATPAAAPHKSSASKIASALGLELPKAHHAGADVNSPSATSGHHSASVASLRAFSKGAAEGAHGAPLSKPLPPRSLPAMAPSRPTAH